MNLITWAKNHYWDSLEKDKDLIIRHLRTFSSEYIDCPFCGDKSDFDLIGLKYHLNTHCEEYRNTENIT